MDNDSSRNTVIFVLCAMAILVIYQVFVLGPEAKKAQLQRAQAAAMAQHNAPAASGNPAPVEVTGPIVSSPRVPIDTPKLRGSIALVGARFDDLYLKDYHTESSASSPNIELLRPENADHPWFAVMGWQSAQGVALPTANTTWTAQAGAKLTPTTPLQLTYDNGQGLVFHRTITVDSNYMFAVTDTVTNTGGVTVTLNASNAVAQRGLPADPSNSSIVHEGAIGQLDGKLSLARYKCTFGMIGCIDWSKKQQIESDSTGGWLGLTQKYWLTALIPDQSTPIHAEYVVKSDNNVPVYEVDYRGPNRTVAPGATLSTTSRLFAGAKIVPLLSSYDKSLGVPHFENAVDWGIFWFFTHPIFILLEVIKKYLGNIGLSILALTVLVKAVFFPLANKSYESISKMKKIQPLMEDLKKQYAGDQAKLQQETMQLYQREKINPLMGCLPMLIQIPVFYSLYKVLTVTIEMRQAPFYGWIHDLAAKDPTTVLNLFGLIPWNPAHTPLIGTVLDTNLHIGAWPLIYGFTMWLSQAMNPPQADPTQQRIFQLMPIMFTFIMAPFTVGLLIYWSWNNVLSILQQYVIMRRFKVDNPIDSFFGRFMPKRAAG